MWFELKVSFVWGLVWVFKKLRIITPEDADRHWTHLGIVMILEAEREREIEQRSWGL